MNKSTKIYIAGSLFNAADIAQRIKERQVLEHEFKNIGREVEIYNPIEAPVNDKSKLPTAEDIYLLDKKYLLEADYVIADISTVDLGVAMELGMYIMNRPDGMILAHNSDIRIGNSNAYSGHFVPYGQNQFMIGGILNHSKVIFDSFDDTVNWIIEDVN